MKSGKAAVKAEKKEMKASVKAMTPPAKSKPGVSPNPLVTGGKTLPKLSGAVGGMARNVPKTGMGGLLGAAPKMVSGPKRSTPTPTQATRAADMKARTSGTPKPLIRSTAKPAMPSRKK